MKYPIVSLPEPNPSEFSHVWNVALPHHHPSVPLSEKHAPERFNPFLGEIVSNVFSESIRWPHSELERNRGFFNQVIYLDHWKIARNNLFSEIQDLLCCLAPFASFINMKGLGSYIRYLKEQPALANLPFHLWEDIIQEAMNRGLFSPVSHMPVFLQLDPIFPFFLKTRLYAFERKEKRMAVETAFREYYDSLAEAVYGIMKSNHTDKKALGNTLVKPEYENLVTALYFALDAHESVLSIYRTLSDYLDVTQDHELQLRLGDMVLTGLKDYPREKLNGKLGSEFVVIVDDIARHQLFLGRYSEAERSYQAALNIWLQNEDYDAAMIRKKSGTIYHQLGRVAQEQREWKRAGEYFLKDLEITKEFNDLKGMTTTLRNLRRLWKESGDEKLPEAIAEVLGWKVKA
ncbi:tetratricopeptide repeat protein [Desulfonema magnum]|uniref:Tetratricopeptide repeat-containing n=1 Tax=Desulfonema magnum TaxID=45655 RepID=A0A975BPM8_9BACT|nr:tetratricopeptide repeat protein [Desulfonema magnum]QTA89392.1 tetratricopeptide repeat-containing [Desulfonema magnum]